jgi:ankyrin repeat protein
MIGKAHGWGTFSKCEVRLGYRRLLEKCPAGISVTGVDCHGFTPLHLAVRRGHTAVVERLLHLPSMDANVGATVNASSPSGLKPWESDDLNMCRADLFSKAPKELPTAANLTPLHFAAMDGHTEIVDLLLTWPAIDVAPLDTKGLSPFDYSIQNGHSGVLKLLLEKLENIGEPFTFCDEWLAPLHHSIQKGHIQPFAASHSSSVGHRGKHLIACMTWLLGDTIPPSRLPGACVESPIAAA